MQGSAAAVAKINERVKYLQQLAGQRSRQRMLSVGVRLHQRRDCGWYATGTFAQRDDLASDVGLPAVLLNPRACHAEWFGCQAGE